MLPKRLDRKSIYKSDWINLYVDKVELPSGAIIEKFHQLEYPFESVVILLLDRARNICLIKSRRYSIQKIQLELPAGRIERHEDAVTAGRRELEEETGVTSDNLKFAFSFNPSPGMSDQKVHVVIGHCSGGSEGKTGSHDTDEAISVHWFAPTQIEQMIRSHEIMDGISLIPLLSYFAGFFGHSGNTT